MKRIFLWMLMLGLTQSDGMAHSLHQMMMNHPVFGAYPVTYENRAGYAIAEDDILLGKVSNFRMNAMLTRLATGRWSQGIIPYEMDENLPRANAYAIRDAMELWEQHADVHFVKLTERNRIEYPDYAAFVAVEGSTCASFVGRQGGRQEVQLSTRCKLMTTVHEIGHLLGLWHEQSRSDRDLYVRILWENIEEGHEYNFNQHLTSNGDYGDYDYDSIMHYSPYAFSKNGQKTIVPLIPGILIGQRDRISDGDTAAVRLMYSTDEKRETQHVK